MVKQYKQLLKEMNIEYLLKNSPRNKNLILNEKKIEKFSNLSSFSKKTSIESARELANNAKSLKDLQEIVSNFDLCSLKPFATKTVFSSGINSAKIMCIGEAPGASEDLAGEVFCGESGQLLDKIFASINLSRATNIYLTNTVFWRPPANRNPTQEETDICKPFLEKHISLINPKLIILIGGVAATNLLGKNDGVSKIRQKYYNYTNQYLQTPILMTAIFHPAYLMRSPMQKKNMWYDILNISKFIENNKII
jgi:DNA polymerase